MSKLPVFLAVGERELAAGIEARGDVLDALDLDFHLFVILVGETDPAPGLESLVGNRCLSAPHPDAVHGVVAELVLDPVGETRSRPQEHHQHEDSPGDAEAGEEGPELVLPDSGEDLLPLVEVEHRSAPSGS
jgi:hypothetical protein